MCPAGRTYIPSWPPVSQTCMHQIVYNGKVNEYDFMNKYCSRILYVTCDIQSYFSAAICTCSSGFLGADCSINESQPPELHSSENTGLCDLRSRNCTDFKIYGSNFLDKTTLTCHLEEAMVTILISDYSEIFPRIHVQIHDSLSYSVYLNILPYFPI